MLQNRITKNHGFTLIELIVVISLISILSALTAASFDLTGWFWNYRLKQSAKHLFLNMQKARMNAIMENKDWGILFVDSANGSYCLQYEPFAESCPQPGEPFAENIISLEKDISYGHGGATTDVTGSSFTSDITFDDGGDKRAIFNSLGLPSNSDEQYCYLMNPKGDAYAVGTSPAGQITIKKWKADVGEWR